MIILNSNDIMSFKTQTLTYQHDNEMEDKTNWYTPEKWSISGREGRWFLPLQMANIND